MAHYRIFRRIDLAVQALAGFLSVNDGPDGRPFVPGAAKVAVLAAGLTAPFRVLMALIGANGRSRALHSMRHVRQLLPWCVPAGSAIRGQCGPRSASSSVSAGRVLSGFTHR